MSIEVSLVIPSQNRGRVLGICLDCLARQDYPADKYEIVVVDDASTDDTEQIAQSFEATCRLKYLKQPEKVGTAAAKNIGVNEAEGDVVIFVDDDAFAPPWFVSEHVRSHRAHPNCVVDGPAINVQGESQLGRPAVTSLHARFAASLGFWGQAFVNANASCLRADIIRAGGFDEEFRKWQDLELYQRFREMGLKRVRNRRAYVLHYKPCVSGLLARVEQRKNSGRYAGMFYLKHPSAWAGRKARLRYLGYDRLFERLGWLDRCCMPERLGELERSKGLAASLRRKVCMIHSWAEGLRSVLGDSPLCRRP